MTSFTLSEASPTLSLTVPVAWSTLPSRLRSSSPVSAPADSLRRPFASSVLPSSAMVVPPGRLMGMSRSCPGRRHVMPPRLPAPLRALLDAGSALIRQSSSGRVALARAADLVHEDALPRAMRRLPETLDAAYLQAAERLDAKRIKKALRELDDVDAEPVAVRPAAQVHAGELDGEPVVAKVRRPG